MSESETVPVGLPTLNKVTVAVASSVNPQGSVNLFPSLMLCKGEVLARQVGPMYVTWYELIEFIMALITLAFVIMSYLNSKKR